MTPTVPHGPLEGAKYWKVSVSREDERREVIPGRDGDVPVLQASIGGGDAVGGYYFAFRGEPEEILEMLDVVHEAAKNMLPRGQYKDKRTPA